MRARYSFRCTNPDCMYHKRTTEGLSTKAYGKECSNCVFYDETSSTCLKKQRKTKPNTYYGECWVLNPDKEKEMTRYCYVCGWPVNKVPPVSGEAPVMFTRNSNKKQQKEETKTFSLENGRTQVKITKGGRSLNVKKD